MKIYYNVSLCYKVISEQPEELPLKTSSFKYNSKNYNFLGFPLLTLPKK